MHAEFLGMTSERTTWPDELESRYERIEVLGKGSFGMVWMAQRRGGNRKPRHDGYDDEDCEFVAIKNISIKDEKGKVYAEREIAILGELRHPNVVRLVKAYPVQHNVRVVVMQLAQGPNLHQLVVKRGALGLPLARMVSRQLIAAVSYLHGRAVIHRDIKPSNVILACNDVSPVDGYDWLDDDAIWSGGMDCEDGVKNDRWRLFLVDFGFSRALETSEVKSKKHLRNSIVFEGNAPPAAPPAAAATAANNSTDTAKSGNKDGAALPPTPELADSVSSSIAAAAAEVAATDDGTDKEEEDGDDPTSDEARDKFAADAARSVRRMSYQPTNGVEDAIMGDGQKQRKRVSGISMALPETSPPRKGKRASTARFHVRSMSALGTKAYAAPEIRRKLRHKNEEDFEKENAAMTECVADYGMIVDAYSVGWTLRVAMTGVPPNFTISQYMRERDNVVIEGSEEDQDVPDTCCCLGGTGKNPIRVRDPAGMPNDATLLIRSMTEKQPEARMTVREAQNHPWIAGKEGEEPYVIPQGDYPSKHGDPVVPLKCAAELSQLTVAYHTN